MYISRFWREGGVGKVGWIQPSSPPLDYVCIYTIGSMTMGASFLRS